MYVYDTEGGGAIGGRNKNKFIYEKIEKTLKILIAYYKF